MAAITTTDRYTKASYWRAAGQFGHTVLLLAVAVSLAFESLSFHYGLTIALTIVASVAYLRLFMIGHDCAHGSYLPYRWQNDLLGNVIGILTNTPVKYWARQHAKHHPANRLIRNFDRIHWSPAIDSCVFGNRW